MCCSFEGTLEIRVQMNADWNTCELPRLEVAHGGDVDAEDAPGDEEGQEACFGG